MLYIKYKDNFIAWEQKFYPAGEPIIRFGDKLDTTTSVELKIKDTSPSTLVTLAAMAHQLVFMNIKVKIISLYLPAGREDKRGKNFFMEMLPKEVSVVTYDIHTDSWLRIYKNLISIDRKYKEETRIIVVPDEGALSKYTRHTNKVVFNKERDPNTGKITSMKMVSGKEFIEGNDLVIQDDICDGGRTFIEIAKILKPYKPKSLELKVSHGIFSKGKKELYKYFNKLTYYNKIEQKS